MAKTFETSEVGTKEYLQTHYYKTLIEPMMKFLPDMLEHKMGCKILSVNDDYMEITAYHADYDLTLKVVMPEINKTSVDIFIDSRFVFDFGKTKNIILQIYDNIAKQFEFVGLSLNRDK